MKQSSMQHDLDGVLESVNNEVATTPKTSYQATRWSLVNRVLAIVDRITNGKAGMLQRLFSFLFVGGLGAVVNLVLFNLLYVRLYMPIDPMIHNVLAMTVSYEISLLLNFTLNDYFTFRHLDGHARSWFARCSRFHVTAVVGFFLTLFFQFVFHFFFNIHPSVAQAMAILLVLVYNFAAHHLFTYRHVKSPALALEEAFDEGARELATAMSGSTDAHRALR